MTAPRTRNVICEDDGHLYLVPNQEGPGWQTIRFLKRSSKMIQHPEEWPGIVTQDLIRVAIARTEYLYEVGPCEETANTLHWLKMALYEYEARAWRRKQQKLNREANPEAATGDVAAHREYYEDVPFTPDSLLDLPIGEDGHVIVKSISKEAA